MGRRRREPWRREKANNCAAATKAFFTFTVVIIVVNYNDLHCVLPFPLSRSIRIETGGHLLRCWLKPWPVVVCNRFEDGGLSDKHPRSLLAAGLAAGRAASSRQHRNRCGTRNDVNALSASH